MLFPCSGSYRYAHGLSQANANLYLAWGCCQTKANRSLLEVERLRSGGQLPPLGQGGLPVLLEPVAGVEVSVEIEMVVDGRVEGCELLKTSHLPEAEHRSFPSSYW